MGFGQHEAGVKRVGMVGVDPPYVLNKAAAQCAPKLPSLQQPRSFAQPDEVQKLVPTTFVKGFLVVDLMRMPLYIDGPWAKIALWTTALGIHDTQRPYVLMYNNHSNHNNDNINGNNSNNNRLHFNVQPQSHP